jgi:endonuclease III
MSEGAPIGLVGLGAMGGRMARLLLEDGHALSVYDTRPDAVAALAERGAVPAGSAAEVADVAETVLASLPTPDVVREAVCGVRGVVHGKAVRIFVDVSTTGATASEEIGRALAASDVVHVDAPVSGGVAGLEAYIKRIGLYRTKAKNVVALSQMLLEKHCGAVPQNRAALEALPGVGRKTANVVLNTAFGQPTVAVDTHIFRVSNRTGIAPGKDPLEVELKLLKFTPPEYLQNAHHWLILHGRHICLARKPGCPQCLIRDLCEFRPKTRGGDADV